MSNTPRNKVNIVAVCAANLAAVSEKIEVALKASHDARWQVSAITARHKAELDASQVEHNEIAILIKANERQEVPTEKLEKKAAAIRESIEKIALEHSNSKELAHALAATEVAQLDLKAAEDMRELHSEQLRLAEELKTAFEQTDLVGAIVAPEYLTLDEALDDYIKNIPLMVSISEDMTVFEVGMWHCPNVPVPYMADVYAKKDQRYKFNSLPSQLSWLRQFPGSGYDALPTANDSELKVGNVVCLLTTNNDDEINNAESEEESIKMERVWMGAMYPRFECNDSSLFAPDGVSYETNKGAYVRSGLCFIKSEGKFYSQRNESFPSVLMVPGKVKQSDGRGNIQTVDGLVPKVVPMNLTKLMESFFAPLADRIRIAGNELEDLSSAKSILALRFKEALDSVCVLESPFELSGKRLSEFAVHEAVGAYWNAFINAPWEPTVVGDVAMIKHLCSRKIEFPHFFSFSIRGHYGLRVRTRDHDWITAQIYCPPTSLSPKVPVNLDDVVYLPNGYVRVGPCLIMIMSRQK